MSRTVPIEVYLLAKTRVLVETENWLHDQGVSEDGVKRLCSAEKTHAEKLIECAGRRCYKSFEVGLNPNVSKIREDIGEYLENILKAGHGSVLEHVTFTFAIENVSRVFTGEMNRHRAGMAISEGSMRYIRYNDIPYWLPTSITELDARAYQPEMEQLTRTKTVLGMIRRLASELGDHEGGIDSVRELKSLVSKLEAQLLPPLAGFAPTDEDSKAKSRQVFDLAFKSSEYFYGVLQETWAAALDPKSAFKAKKEITSMMRRIIPMGVATGGIWTGNVRALRHICEMRCSAAAEEEILLVAGKILGLMQEEEPNLFGDFSMVEGYFKPKYSKV